MKLNELIARLQVLAAEGHGDTPVYVCDGADFTPLGPIGSGPADVAREHDGAIVLDLTVAGDDE